MSFSDFHDPPYKPAQCTDAHCGFDTQQAVDKRCAIATPGTTTWVRFATDLHRDDFLSSRGERPSTDPTTRAGGMQAAGLSGTIFFLACAGDSLMTQTPLGTCKCWRRLRDSNLSASSPFYHARKARSAAVTPIVTLATRVLTHSRALIVPPRCSHSRLRYVDHIETEGEFGYRHAIANGLEGVVGKPADSPYVGGRSRD
jgi:hypothetical protein